MGDVCDFKRLKKFAGSRLKRCRPGAVTHSAAFGSDMKQSRPLNAKQTWKRAIRLSSLLVAAGFFMVSQAKASFIGNYAFANFTLNNQNADGSAQTPDGGLSVILTGGNNGSGLSGTTDLFITASGAGIVHFQYSYFSLDVPPFDVAGFLVDGLFTPLTDTSGDVGIASFSIAQGQTFGFRISTLDNLGEPGILTVSGFDAPSASAAAPEPVTWPAVVVAALVAGWRWRRNRSGREEEA
jgi:hypothetical protein